MLTSVPDRPRITPQDFKEALKDWSALDIVECIKLIGEEFGILPFAPQVVQVDAPQIEEPQEEQIEFVVLLKAVGEKKIEVIKAVRELTGLSLKDTKDLVDGAPVRVLEEVSKPIAETAVARLKLAGAEALYE